MCSIGEEIEEGRGGDVVYQVMDDPEVTTTTNLVTQHKVYSTLTTNSQYTHVSIFLWTIHYNICHTFQQLHYHHFNYAIQQINSR